MGLDGIFGGSKANSVQGSKGPSKVQGSSPTDSVSMQGDSYTSSCSPIQKEIETMTPKQAEHARSLGGYAAVGGVLAVGAAYWAGPAIVMATGITAAPIVLGVAGAALALWGALRFATGVGASLNQVTKKAFTLE